MKQQDCLRRFIFEEHGVRGEWVRLQTSLVEAKQHQRIADDAVDAQMGQALAAVVLLSATIKFKGAMIMQIQGGGDLTALVAQASNDRNIRGLVRSADKVSGANLREMVGAGGRLVLTVESENAEPYQGIVGIEADTLAEVLEVYFKQSEQLNTRLWLFADRNAAAGLLIQELPGEHKDPADWERLEMLAATVTAQEIFTLDCEDLLYRLFHQEKVRIFDPEAVEFKCTCSRQKIAGTLLMLGRSELHAILQERDDIEIDCQFCGAQYRFDQIDVENLLTNPAAETETNPPTRH
ncbi:Hsp33 family molecular chaperone HslO [Methylomonas sp. EFPC3]|uniref:Hsp33 family molecular chaperone HslO n=1 Tax=unclassified Methylomonas TaxID=2608980 RepID=UPI0024162F33|nr:Hsp33 family molecular chaperone HslO [Methylomonas sp. EFPC3]WFP50034.1 Hsp33 family molecular chaperone HslO [Methylomonas sp. EFPC3]